MDMEFLFDLNTRREISYLQATMYNFVYRINTLVFYWQEKSSLSMNENKRIDNPRVQKKRRRSGSIEKMRWNTKKKTMSVMLKTQNSQVLGQYLPEKEIFQVRDQTRPVANLPVVDFRSQPREMPSPKPLNT